jgi:hypothetical protein
MSSNYKLEKRFVTHCLFLTDQSLYCVVVTDKKKEKSWLEVYAFTHTGVVSDSYLIRGSTTGKTSDESPNRPSVHQALSQPGARAN